MPSARAVFLFPPSGYNVHTSFRPQNAATRFLKAQTSNYIADKKKPVERAYGLLLYIRLFAGTPYGRVNDAGARLLHSVGCLYVRAGAAVSGCFCGCCDRSDRPSVRSIRREMLRLISRSGDQVSRCTVSGSGGARPSQGGFVSVPSVHALLSTSLRLFKSRQGESREPKS